MAEVSEEAGVTRSTLYRYFAHRSDLVLGLVVSRMDAAYARIVASLPHPEDAARSITDIILAAAGLVDGDPLNEALWSDDSRDVIAALGVRAEVAVDTAQRHLGPLLEGWQAAGQVHADLDVHETIRWINVHTTALISPPWRERSGSAKRQAVDRYLVRALVVPQ
jgi:AcrR family transcriptional regulator